MGKVLCLRGGEEQRFFKISQFKQERDSYVYLRIANRVHVVFVLARPESCLRCLVYLLDMYLGKLPVWSKENDVFYVRLAKIHNHSDRRHKCAPAGKEKLWTYLTSMCEEAGIGKGKQTTVSGIIAMFVANVSEKIVCNITGHHSSMLLLYEHPVEEQQRSVSDLLLGGTPGQNQLASC